MLNLMTILLLIISCKKPDDNFSKPPASLNENKLEIIWSSDLLPNGAESLSITPILYGKSAIYTCYGKSDSIENAVLFFNKKTGSLEEHINLQGINAAIFGWESEVALNSKIYFSRGKRLNIIDMATRSLHWHGAIPSGSTQIYAINNYLYRATQPSGVPSFENAIERSTNGQTWERVFKQTSLDGNAGSFDCITKAELPNGDELILFKRGSWNFDSAQGRMDLFCYNLTADSLMWRNIGVEDAGNGVMPMQVLDSVIYAPGAEHFFAVNLYSGQVIWEFDYGAHSGGDNVGYGDFFINGDRLLLKPSGEHLLVFNRHSGQIIHNRLGMGYSMPGRFTHFEGKLFYIGDKELKIVDDYDGRSLLPSIRQDHLGNLDEGVTIDPQTRLMYLTTFHKALCVRLPEDL
jgi:outer membrane protein assembly factor BamB